MFKIIADIIKFFNMTIDEFMNFIIINNLTSIFFIGIISISIAGLISSLKINILDYYLNKLFKTNNNNLISFVTSILYFFIIIIFLFIIYKLFIKNVFNKKQSNFNEVEWKNNMLLELKNINININNKKT